MTGAPTLGWQWCGTLRAADTMLVVGRMPKDEFAWRNQRDNSKHKTMA